MDWNQTKPPLGSQINWAHPLSKGIVGCWLFNEGMGDKVYDLSGNGNTGTLTGFSHPATVTSGWNPGKFGKGLTYDSIANNSTVINNNSKLLPIESTALFTLIGWVTSTYSANYVNLFGFHCTTYGVSWAGVYGTVRYLQSFNGGYYFWGMGSGDFSTGVPFDNDNVLHLVAITVTKSNIYFYRDGILRASADRPFFTTLTGNIITTFGKTLNLPSMGGKIHSIIYYNRALSPQEVLQLYTSPFCFIN